MKNRIDIPSNCKKIYIDLTNTDLIVNYIDTGKNYFSNLLYDDNDLEVFLSIRDNNYYFNSPNGDISSKIELTIDKSLECDITIKNKYRNVIINNSVNKPNVYSNFGNIYLNDCDSVGNIETISGNIEINNIGDFKYITSISGNISVKNNIQKDIKEYGYATRQIKSKTGNVSLDNIVKDYWGLHINTTSGNVLIKDSKISSISCYTISGNITKDNTETVENYHTISGIIEDKNEKDKIKVLSKEGK